MNQHEASASLWSISNPAITYWRTRRGSHRIEWVEVRAETGRMVQLMCGDWVRKRGAEYQYHATRGHARYHLAKRTKAELRAAEIRVDELQKLLAELTMEGAR